MCIKKVLFLLLISFKLVSLDFYPTLVAHRGASLYRPENTLLAFELAYQMGAKAIEFDCWLTLDQEVVIHHDPTLYHTAKIDLPICSLNLDQLKEHDVGSWFSLRYEGAKIPTLSELVSFANGKELTLFIEVKDPNLMIVDKIYQILKEAYSKNPYLLLSRDLEILKYASEKYPEIETAYVLDEWSDQFFEKTKKHNIKHLIMKSNFVRKDQVRELKEKGYKIYIFTVNEDSIAREYIEYGVDGIISDCSRLNV